MYATTALKQYQAVNLQAQVSEASPHRLIQMLMEGALSRLAQAKGAMLRGQTGTKGELIGQAISIIGGLREGLDFQQGGEVAVNLDRLYEYMVHRLLQANLQGDMCAVEEVAGLLRNVKAGWDALPG
jgi:flagellar protein FliS